MVPGPIYLIERGTTGCVVETDDEHAGQESRHGGCRRELEQGTSGSSTAEIVRAADICSLRSDEPRNLEKRLGHRLAQTPCNLDRALAAGFDKVRRP